MVLFLNVVVCGSLLTSYLFTCTIHVEYNTCKLKRVKRSGTSAQYKAYFLYNYNIFLI